jgi:hypothetical protein
MRWRFRDPKLAEEAARREEIVAAIEGWWTAFAADAGEVAAALAGRDPDEMRKVVAYTDENLSAIEEDLGFEYGRLPDGGWFLALCVTHRPHLRPIVREILRRAPSVPGWKLLDGRPLYDADTALETVRHRTGVDLAGVPVRVSVGPYRQVNLAFDVAGDPDPVEAMLIATELLVGASTLVRRIDVVTTEGVRAEAGVDDAEVEIARGPVEQLKAAVVQAIGMVGTLIPEAPYAARDLGAPEPFALEPAEPDDSGDFPEAEDVRQVNTFDFDLWAAEHLGRLFASSRYSSSGETFCYLKLAREGGIDREAVFKSLTAALSAAGAGCVTALATGVAYEYVDLALTSLKAGIEAVRRAVRDLVPNRSWLLFFDAEHRAEWAGIHAGAPPPPEPCLDPVPRWEYPEYPSFG